MTGPPVQLTPEQNDQVTRTMADMLVRGVPDDSVKAWYNDNFGPHGAVTHPTPPPADAASAANLHAEFKSGALQKRMASENAADQAQVGGDPVVNALVNIIPKGSPLEALQAGARVAASRVPVLNRLMGGQENYSQALGDIRAAKENTNPLVRGVLGTVGTAAQIGALPGSLPTQMALYGAAHGLLNPDIKDVQADPASAATHRAISGGVQAGLGWLGGRVLPSFLPALPGAGGATAEQVAAAKDAEIAAATNTAGRLAGTASRTAFGAPDVAAAETAAQTAANAVANRTAERAMITRGAAAADAVLTNRAVPHAALSDPSQSATAFINSISQMTPQEAQAALDGFAGKTTDFFRKNPPIGGFRKLFGLVPGVRNTLAANRAAPIIQALRDRAGAASMDLPAAASINTFLQSLGSTDQQQ